MSLNASKVGDSRPRMEPMEPATYPARTVHFADLGLQARPDFAGETKPPVNMVALTYEFVDCFVLDEEGNDDISKPRHLTEMVPFYSMDAERAKSTARIKALDPSGAANGDLLKLLDVPCMVTVVHNPRKEGGVWENVAGVAPMREKDAKACPPLVNPPRALDLDNPDLDVFNSLPKFIQDKIKAGLDFEGSNLDGLLGYAEAGPDDDIPFDGGDDDENPY